MPSPPSAPHSQIPNSKYQQNYTPIYPSQYTHTQPWKPHALLNESPSHEIPPSLDAADAIHIRQFDLADGILGSVVRRALEEAFDAEVEELEGGRVGGFVFRVAPPDCCVCPVEAGPSLHFSLDPRYV